MSWENLFLPYVNNNDADQQAHPRSLISVFVIRCPDSIIPLVSISEISSLLLVSVAEQAGVANCWRQVFSWCGSYGLWFMNSNARVDSRANARLNTWLNFDGLIKPKCLLLDLAIQYLSIEGFSLNQGLMLKLESVLIKHYAPNICLPLIRA